MSAGDKYINNNRKHLTTNQVFRSLIREDENGKPFIKTNFSPSSTNSIVQAWLDKIALDGYTLPSEEKIAIYNAAWDYADSEGITPELDLLGLLKVENENLCKIPFIHSGGASRRFTLINSPVFTANKGLKSNGVGYLNTNWVVSTDAVNLQVNDASIALHTDYTLQNSGYAMGVFTSPPNSALIVQPQLTNTAAACYVLNLSPVQAVVGSPSGLTSGNILAGTAKLYRNGAQIYSAAQVSTPLPTSSLFVCTGNIGGGPSGYYPGDIQIFIAGSGSIDHAKLNTFVNMLLL